MLMETASVKSARCSKRPCDLSEDGVVLAVATVDFNSKMILAGPDILSRGFIYMRESGELIRESQRVLFNAIRIAMRNKDANIQTVNGAIVNALRPFLYEKQSVNQSLSQ